MDLASLVGKRREHLAELEFRMGQPDFFDDPARAARCTREHRRLQSLVALWEDRENVARALADNRQLAKGDDELADMAAEEIPGLEARLESLEQETRYALLPRDAAEDRDAILEIRAGTGGDEAALFAGDLLRMYSRYAEKRGWRAELMEASPSEAGGFKEAIARVSGEEVFRWLKYESGVHRVQRVPATEAQGRIHTSTATVAVLPEAEEVDVALRAEDLRIDVCRSGGAGGQHVNRTESAVQILHIPTGIMVRCEDGRSQTKNKEKGLMLLRAKLLERERGQQAEAYSEHRRKLIGSGGREEKIRTYNFPQNRVTDHRIGLTLYNLDTVMEGAMDPLINALQASEMADRLHELAG